MKRPNLQSSAQVAKILEVDEAQVRHLARQHGIGFKIGRNWLFSSHDVAKLKKRPQPGRRAGS